MKILKIIVLTSALFCLSILATSGIAPSGMQAVVQAQSQFQASESDLLPESYVYPKTVEYFMDGTTLMGDRDGPAGDTFFARTRLHFTSLIYLRDSFADRIFSSLRQVL